MLAIAWLIIIPVLLTLVELLADKLPAYRRWEQRVIERIV